MKQRKINLKFLAAIGIAFAILFGFIFAGGGYLFCGKNVEDNVSSVNNSASVSAAITPAATNSRYGTFAHGANYSYTAYFTTFKPDTRQYTTYDGDDTYTVVVDSRQPHGSWQNPYVINSTTHWNNLYTDTGTEAKAKANTEGKFFALTTDLSFSGTFPSLVEFHGTLFGLGHKIVNPVYANDQSQTGLIKTARSAATVTDLIVESFSITNFGVALAANTDVGGIVGYAQGGVCFFNVHVQGSVALNNKNMNAHGLGGLVGRIIGTNATSVEGESVSPFTAYRCSSQFTLNYRPTQNNGSTYTAGIVGNVSRNIQVNIIDCYTDISATMVFNTTIVGISYFAGACATVNTNSDIIIKNFVSNIFLSYIGSTMPSPVGITAGVWACTGEQTALNTKRAIIENTYSNCELLFAGSANRSSIVPINSFTDAKSSEQSTFYNKINKSFTNYNHGKVYDYGHDNSYFRLVTKDVGAYSNLGNLWADAKTKFDSLGNHWGNGGSAFGTTGYTYSLDHAPVRKVMKTSGFTVNYYRLVNGQKQSAGVNASSYNYGGTPTFVRATNLSENQTFVGWTQSATEEVLYTASFPSNFYGDLELYAVWELPVNAVNAEIVASGGADDSGVYKAPYSSSGGISLTANITSDYMRGADVFYSWSKTGDTSFSDTNQTLTLRTVKESGTYTLTYTLCDKSEPLWRRTSNVDSSLKPLQKQVEITPGKLVLQSLTLTSNAYVGKPFREVTFDAVVTNESGTVISGTAVWKFQATSISESDPNNTFIVFTPDASNDGNYGATQELAATVKPEYLQVVYEMVDFSGMTVTHNLEYNGTCTASELVAWFRDGYRTNFLENPEFAGQLDNLAPFFSLTKGGTPIKLSAFNQSYNRIQKEIRIYVTLDSPVYTATFYEDGTAFSNGTVYHTVGDLYYNNQIIDQPATPTRQGEIFLGWYFDTFDGDGNAQNRAWDFDTDRMVDDVVLIGKWITAELRLKDLEITQLKDITAQQSVANGDIRVVGVYEVTNLNDMEDQRIPLTLGSGSFGTYKIAYRSSGDNKLHVVKEFTGTNDATRRDAITVTSEGVSKTKILNVVPISVDVSSLPALSKYGAGTGEVIQAYTGEAINLSPVNPGEYPQNVTGVTFQYVNSSGDIVDAENVIAMGGYLVKFIFTMTGDDYAPKEEISIRLIIRNVSSVNIEWDTNTFVYNGQAQHPKPTFTDSDGNVLEVPFHYTGGDDAVTVGSYTVKIELDSDAYTLSGVGVYSFTITKAVLKTPVFKGGIEYTGEKISLIDGEDPEKWLEGFNPYIMEIATDSDATGTQAKKYSAVIRLKDTNNCSWESTASRQITVQWEIEKAHLSAIWDGYEHLADGKPYYPKIERFIGIVAADANAIKLTTDVSYTGDVNVSEVGSYVIRATINSSASWAANYVLDDGQEWSFVIVPKSGMQIISIEWGVTEFTFNGEIQKPAFTVMLEESGKDPVDITAQATGALILSDVTSKWAGNYTVTVSAKDGSNYFIRKGATCDYRIVTNEAGEGADPNGTPVGPGDGDIDDKNPSGGFTLPADMPWWQLALGIVSIILIIVFTSKGAKYGSERKKCIKQTTKIMARSAAYPVALLALFGVENKIYTIVAIALAGLAVLALIYMIVQKRRLATAEEGLENAKEEHLLAEKREQDDERRKREEEFKMMMASMMNPNAQMQGGFVGGDVREIVGEVVASLMPAMQQSMALPEPSNELRQVLEQQQRMIEQQGQMIEQLAYNQQQTPALPAPDDNRIAELEERMAEQQRLAEERAAEQQRIADERLAQQQAMMIEQQRLADERIAEQQRIAEERAAEQQRLSEERMERLMMQLSERETNPSSQTIVQTDDGLRDILEKHGEMLDALMNKENVNKTVYINNEAAVARPEVEPVERLTLREAYALMPKNYQKLFDQVEKYILAKSETVESEGKFAITFKCKAKQFVKLCIKKGFPTMQYTTEGEQLRTLRKKAAQEEGVKVRFKMSELQVYDESTYEVAKGVIDLRAEQVDRDVEYAKEQRLLKRKANKTE